MIGNCDYVLHVASPFPLVDDKSTVTIAVDGTLNVLKACSKCPSVRKVVLTSSCAAVNEGHEDEDRAFSEEDWTNLDSNKVLHYARSKTVAEQEAWKFVKENSEFLSEFGDHAALCRGPPVQIDDSEPDFCRGASSDGHAGDEHHGNRVCVPKF